jgi:SAM-dependent methyltransferase
MLETRSGDASTLAATSSLRPALGKWLRAQGIRSLVDAGCGDFNWMQAVDLGGLDFYLGYDIVPELIARNQQLYGNRRGHFFAVADIARTPLPACDAILCRRVLCDMPEEEALRALAGFRASGARYLIASTRAYTGDDAPLARDLLAAPFDLPRPRAFVLDGNGAVLGVWPLAAAD